VFASETREGMRMKIASTRVLGSAAAAAMIMTAVVAGGNTSGASVQSKAPIDIGFVLPETGAQAGSYDEVLTGAMVRVKLLNAGGGIHGRDVKILEGDDQSTPQGAMAAVQSLIARGVVGVSGDASNLAGAAEQFLAQRHVPLVMNASAPTSVADTNLFSPLGLAGPSEPLSTSVGTFLKSLGVTKMAGLAWGSVPTSVALMQGALAATSSAGIKTVLTDLTPSPTTIDYTPDALKIKQSGAQSIYFPATNAANVALAAALQQQGIHLKVPLFGPTVYDPAIMSSPHESAFEGAYVQSWLAPASLNTPQVKAFVAATNKYSHGSFGYFYTSGYVFSDLLITGIEGVHGSPNAANVATALSHLTDYTGAGLTAKRINFTLPRTAVANVENCFWYLKIKNHTYVAFDSKPIC
jgi:branched-chain amino acid transport system substrate-binding protein